MDRIHYAGDSILTGSEIARAVLDYAEALAQAGTAATVTIPTIDAAGQRGQSTILVGPASQLITDSVPSEFEDIVDELLVARLARDARQLRLEGPPRPAAAEQPPPDYPAWPGDPV